MIDYGLLHRGLAELVAGADLHDGLHRLSVTAAAALDLDGAGVTLRVPGGKTNYITAANPVTLHVERRQDELQEGACVDAIESSQIVAFADVSAARPWPNFTAVLLDAGFRAAAGVPIRFQGLNIGALNLYDRDSRQWTTDECDASRLVADVAAGYLINAELLRTTQLLVDQLQFALDSRVIIEQAKGVVAGRHGVTPEAAFEVMRSYARSERRKLHDVARDVVAEQLDLLEGSAGGEAGDATADS